MADIPPTPTNEGPTLEQVVATLRPEFEKRMQAFEDKVLRDFQKLETEVKEFKASVKDSTNKFENATKSFESLKEHVQTLVDKINKCIEEIRAVGGKNIERVGRPNVNPPKEDETKGGFGFFRS